MMEQELCVICKSGDTPEHAHQQAEEEWISFKDECRKDEGVLLSVISAQAHMAYGVAQWVYTLTIVYVEIPENN
jgi:hypothetical protein